MRRDQPPDGYPVHRIVDVGLRDGSTIRIRPSLSDDLDAVEQFFARLSSTSSRFRFHGTTTPTRSMLERFVDNDYTTTLSLVAEAGEGLERRCVAVATYVETDTATCEMALAVDDAFQGLGLGSILIEHLGEAAAAAGFTTFQADVMSSNADMLEVLRHLDLPMKTSSSAGVVRVDFPTSPTPEAIESFEQREASSASAGVARLLKPRSVAVIGDRRRLRRSRLSGEPQGGGCAIRTSLSVRTRGS
jgi:GNAT superfamily N-acetyltransferase